MLQVLLIIEALVIITLFALISICIQLDRYKPCPKWLKLSLGIMAALPFSITIAIGIIENAYTVTIVFILLIINMAASMCAAGYLIDRKREPHTSLAANIVISLIILAIQAIYITLNALEKI